MSTGDAARFRQLEQEEKERVRLEHIAEEEERAHLAFLTEERERRLALEHKRREEDQQIALLLTEELREAESRRVAEERRAQQEHEARRLAKAKARLDKQLQAKREAEKKRRADERRRLEVEAQPQSDRPLLLGSINENEVADGMSIPATRPADEHVRQRNRFSIMLKGELTSNRIVIENESKRLNEEERLRAEAERRKLILCQALLDIQAEEGRQLEAQHRLEADLMQEMFRVEQIHRQVEHETTTEEKSSLHASETARRSLAMSLLEEHDQLEREVAFLEEAARLAAAQEASEQPSSIDTMKRVALELQRMDAETSSAPAESSFTAFSVIPDPVPDPDIVRSRIAEELARIDREAQEQAAQMELENRVSTFGGSTIDVPDKDTVNDRIREYWARVDAEAQGQGQGQSNSEEQGCAQS